MKEKKSILILTPRFPYPVIGGDRLRIYEICKELSKEYKLILCSLCENQKEMVMDVSDDSVFETVHRVYLSKARSALNCLLALPTKTPLQVAYYHSAEYASLVSKLAQECDGVLCHLIRTAEYAKSLPKIKFLEMTDAISMNYLRVSSFRATDLKSLIYKFEQARLEAYEKKIVENFDLNVLVSKVDKDFLIGVESTIVSEKTLVCSNGVSLEKLPYVYNPSSNELVYIGNMYSTQNFDAAYWFAKEVLPLLNKRGNFVFKVIGRITKEKHQRLNSLPNVLVTGAVDNVVEHVYGAFAGICSVRLAAGIQNKILEYMALGLPTVTSQTGLEGLEALPGKDILVADKPHEYVDHILKLFNDREYALQISQAGFAYVKGNHAWSARLSPLLDRVKQSFIV